jgi:HEAT repeat protein
MLKEKAAPAKQQLTSLLDDPVPEVAIAASEALYYLDESAKALDRLKKALDNDSGDGKLRLKTLNVIRSLGKGALPLLPKLNDMLQHIRPIKGENYEPRILQHMIVQLTKIRGERMTEKYF